MKLSGDAEMDSNLDGRIITINGDQSDYCEGVETVSRIFAEIRYFLHYFIGQM